MRYLLVLLILLLGGLPGSLAQDSIRVDLDLQDAPMEKLAASIQDQTGIRLYYRTRWTEPVKITISGTDLPLFHSLDRALVKYGLHFYFQPPDRLMILPDSRLSTDLSHLYEASSGSEELSLSGTAGEANGDYLETTRPEQLVRTLVVGSQGNSRSNRVARIRGRIRDVDSGEPVIGATMVIMETGKGAISDQHGQVTMSMMPGRYNAQFSFIGMEAVNCQLEVLSDGEFQLEMKSTVIALNEVQIIGNHYRDINSTDVGVERLSMNSVKQMPLFMGGK